MSKRRRPTVRQRAERYKAATKAGVTAGGSAAGKRALGAGAGFAVGRAGHAVARRRAIRKGRTPRQGVHPLADAGAAAVGAGLASGLWSANKARRKVARKQGYGRKRRDRNGRFR